MLFNVSLATRFFIAFVPGVRLDQLLTSPFQLWFFQVFRSDFASCYTYPSVQFVCFWTVSVLCFSEVSDLIENAVIGCCFSFLFCPTSILSLQREQNHKSSEVKEALNKWAKMKLFTVLWNFLHTERRGLQHKRRGVIFGCHKPL